LGISEQVPPGLPFAETLDRIRAQGGIAIVPHPFQSSRHGVATELSHDELAKADAIEIYNSRLFTGLANRRARAFAERRSLPTTAGSDAHIAEMVGQAVTRVDTTTREVGAILDAILAGDTEILGKRTPWRISLRQFGGGIRRRIADTVRDGA